ncbi:TetR/AcrR family transcriptional regulator [Seohaeicola zhoushanensis]|uniref:TetR family transcriptional regulator n=1 Tax=Seohaeicola zhoushanensis TaxID=1569283 RepID=A0A8J3GXL1_9RHOB|nr:TetR/AcrR family transcriptional regulator [Seohaeicola zhoushanensis]GHF54275.1 TetR family transcriptional regulator [Seohaeicola zhoushanensis]
MGRNRTYDRQDVLDKAMRLFWQNGFQATSIGEVAQATGMNTASMYKEFGDKDGLFANALAHYRGQVMSPRFEMLSREPNLKGVLDFLDNVVRGAAREEYKGCLMMNHLAQKHAISDEAAAMIDDFCAAMESHLEQALRGAQAAGELPASKDPKLLASYIMCSVHGLVLYGRHPSKKDAIPRLHDIIRQAVLN